MISGTNDASIPITPIYQQFPNPAEGTNFTFSAKALVSSSAPLTDAGSSGQIVIKAFDANWGLLGSATSTAVVDMNTAQDSWVDLSVDLTIPAGVANVQFVLEFTQGGTDAGGVYFDATGTVTNQ